MSQNSSVSSLSVRQAKVIPIILQARSIEAGCVQAGLSKARFYKWLKNPQFAEEYQRQRNILIEEAMESLKGSLNKAVNTLTGLLDTENESLRRAVANDVLNNVLKIREMQELDSRLSKVEQLMEEK